MTARRFVFLFLFLFGAVVAHAQPSISSFTPAFGASTDPNYILINGSGFSPGTLVVKFNGVQATTAAALNASQIQARVPAGAPLGPGKLYVQVGANSTLSSQDFYVIGPGPYASSFSPVTGGSGTVVTISGAHFTGVTNILFNGRAGTALFVQSDNSVQITAPAAVTSGPLVIRGPAGVYDTSTNTTTTNFYVSPVLTGFSPAAGRPGTNVVITGTNLLGTSSVLFGSVSASPVTILSNGAVRVTIPASAQTSKILLTAPAGAAQTTSNFVVQPNVTGFSPGSGGPGTPVTVTGENFLGTTAVQFNGVGASFTGVTANQLTATVPSTASGPITVITTNGSSTSLALFYLPPSITSFTPSNSAPGTIVKVTGTSFTNASAFSFNGVPAAAFYVTNNTTIGAVVPNGVSTGPLSVTAPGGSAGSSGFFYGNPGITSFNPTHGLPGTNVVLTGSNFLGATFVRFNGLNASFVPPANNTTLVATVPASATTGPITVGAPGGTNTSAANFVLDYSSDLSLSGTNSPDPVIVGSNLVYSFTIVNHGPFAPPAVQFSNTLSPSVLLLDFQVSQGTRVTNGGVLSVNLGSLGVGSFATISIVVKPLATGTITNVATVTGSYSDPAPADNTLVTTATVLPLPTLSIVPFGPAQVKVSWPVVLTNFVLQAKTNVSPSTSWADVTNPVSISGSERVVTDAHTVSTKYYRLKN